jgi:hypothetical protein
MVNKLYKTTRFVPLFGVVVIAFFFTGTKEMQTCDKYKTGRFYIYNRMNKQRINIERKDSLQIETNENGDITVLKVNWTGPCEYELIFNYMTPKEISKRDDSQKIVGAMGNTPLQINILSGTENYYLFEARKDGFLNLRDTVWLVK